MLSYLLHGVMEYVAHGHTLGRLGNSHPSIAPFDTYQAADELFVICAGGNEVFARLSEAIGRGDLARDERFAHNRNRHENHDSLRAELEATLRTKPASHWVEVLTVAGVPCARIQNIPEAVAMPQIAARNMMIESDGMRILGNPIKIGGFDDSATRPAAPALDGNGDAIRAEFGASEERAAAAKR
jgi:CoA:oxalate CoA-transferase